MKPPCAGAHEAFSTRKRKNAVEGLLVRLRRMLRRCVGQSAVLHKHPEVLHKHSEVLHRSAAVLHQQSEVPRWAFSGWCGPTAW